MRFKVVSILAEKAGVFERGIVVAIPFAANILRPAEKLFTAWFFESVKHSP